jgi:hypothetical protein
MIQRNGEVVLHMLANVQQKTIQPILKQTIQVGSLIFTDEYDIYTRLEAWLSAQDGQSFCWRIRAR